MKCTNFYKAEQQLLAKAIRELKTAVKACGGTVRFDDPHHQVVVSEYTGNTPVEVIVRELTLTDGTLTVSAQLSWDDKLFYVSPKNIAPYLIGDIIEAIPAANGITDVTEKIPVGERLRIAHELVKDIPTSGYWPYASPAPCSTELLIKSHLNSAISQLDGALFLHEKMFGKTGRDPMRAASFAITDAD